jgi:hypothetical protein
MKGEAQGNREVLVGGVLVPIRRPEVVIACLVPWRTVGAIVARVSADTEARTDRLAGLTRLGVGELSYKEGRCHRLQFRGAPRR